jgi:Holliday junction resolvasome RuvABC endonuclease subunit
MTFLGIDPGVSGGVAFITPEGHGAAKMPDTVQDVYNLIRHYKADGGTFALLESVHSSPAMGVVSAFTFGKGFGRLEMALTALEVPWEYISPQKWQKALSCLTGGDKNVSKAKAQQLFPGTKITHAIADALLIAEYARRTHV